MTRTRPLQVDYKHSGRPTIMGVENLFIVKPINTSLSTQYARRDFPNTNCDSVWCNAHIRKQTHTRIHNLFPFAST